MKKVQIFNWAGWTMFLMVTTFLCSLCVGCNTKAIRPTPAGPHLKDMVESLNAEFGGYTCREIYATESAAIEKWVYRGTDVTHIVNVMNGKVHSIQTINH